MPVGSDMRMPHTPAQLFVDALWGQRSLAQAFRWSSPAFNLCVAQQWLYSWAKLPDEYDRDDTAVRLSTTDTTHPLWAQFELEQVRSVQGRGDLSDSDRWQWGANTRVEGADLEVLHLYDGTQLDGDKVPAGGIRTVQFLVRLQENGWWIVENVDSNLLPSPGWPPTFR